MTIRRSNLDVASLSCVILWALFVVSILGYVVVYNVKDHHVTQLEQQCALTSGMPTEPSVWSGTVVCKHYSESGWSSTGELLS